MTLHQTITLEECRAYMGLCILSDARRACGLRCEYRGPTEDETIAATYTDGGSL